MKGQDPNIVSQMFLTFYVNFPVVNVHLLIHKAAIKIQLRFMDANKINHRIKQFILLLI